MGVTEAQPTGESDIGHTAERGTRAHRRLLKRLDFIHKGTRKSKVFSGGNGMISFLWDFSLRMTLGESES